MDQKYWGPRSVTYWLVGLVALLMLFVGVNGFIQPLSAIKGFGLPLHDIADVPIVRIKADRDLFIGIFLSSLLILRMRKASLVFLAASVGMPVVDAVLVLLHATDKSLSWVHITTVIYMVVVSWMLYQEERKANIS
jgi:hypothetical protein